ERVEEAANQVLGLDARATRDGRADENVLLSRVAVQQRLERGEQQHEQRDVFATRQRVERRGQRTRQPEVLQRAAIRFQRRTGPVGRQIECRRRAAELLFPAGELFFEHGALQPTALPT